MLKQAGVNGQFRNGSHLFASALGFGGRRLVTSFPYATPDCRHGCATCKAAVIRRLSRGQRPVVFIGDGLSDRFGVEESDVVFAKGSLLAHCRQTGIDCYAYETFADVRKELSRQLTLDSRPSTVDTQQARVKRRQDMRLALVRTEKI
jgi:hypothetical protein